MELIVFLFTIHGTKLFCSLSEIIYICMYIDLCKDVHRSIYMHIYIISLKEQNNFVPWIVKGKRSAPLTLVLRSLAPVCWWEPLVQEVDKPRNRRNCNEDDRSVGLLHI